MHKLLAFVRVGLLSAASYRLSMVLSLVSLAAITVPIYFVAQAIQPVMADAIHTQGGQYFAFLLLGLIVYQFVVFAVQTIPAAIGSGIRSGTLEAIFTTPTRLPLLLTGMMGYGFLWQVLRSLIYLGTGWVLGAQFVGQQSLIAIAILMLIVLAYVAIGLVSAALILVFRTSGPLGSGVLAGSALLGGVYYPTEVIPSWIQHLSSVIPLTYGLRALRQTFLEGLPLRSVVGDVGILAGLSVLLLIVGSLGFAIALHHARKTGTLAQY